MVSEVVRAEIELDPKVCIDPILASDPKEHIKKVCGNTVEPGQTPDLSALTECLDLNHFCNSCCDYYIGYGNGKHRESCKLKCGEKIAKYQ